MIAKPLLALSKALTKPQLYDLNYPVYGSPKLDGIRLLNPAERGPVSRKFKPIPNDHIRTLLNYSEIQELDGEIITYDHTGIKEFNDIQSDVMSKAGTPQFKFMVFDNFMLPHIPFEQRLDYARDAVRRVTDEVQMVEHVLCHTPDELIDLFDEYLLDGYEGGMIRTPQGIYKQGRSTLKQEILLKYKVFEDAEGVVIGFEEQMTNTNPRTVDATGQSKRSSAKAGLVPAGTLGKIILRTEQWGEVVVDGFTDAKAAEIWANRSKYHGKLVTFRYQPFGMKDKPRFPKFKGFRHEDDT